LFESQTAPKKSAFDGSNVSGREGTTLDLSNIPVEFRGIWVLRLQKLEPEPPADAESSGGGKGTIARDSSTYLFIGTKQCNFHIPKGQFIGSEMTLKSVGRKHNWMSDPMAVFYSQPFYQGKSVTIRYFKDGSWAKPGNDVANFYPKSSIVVNSNWNIENAVDSFCLMAQDDVTFIPNWETAHYVHQETDRSKFPTVSPGCPSRPHQVLQYPEPGWTGRDFCYTLSSH
jgi:hypothetical protein